MMMMTGILALMDQLSRTTITMTRANISRPILEEAALKIENLLSLFHPNTKKIGTMTVIKIKRKYRKRNKKMIGAQTKDQLKK